MQQYIGFKLNKSEYTIPILKVREIINTPTITRLPKSPYYMKGIINLRGRIIPIVDLKELVSSGEGETKATKVIVLSTDRSTFGILVDEITSVINIDEDKIESPQGFMHDNLERVEGVAKFDDRLVILLDTDKLVDEDEVASFGGGHDSSGHIPSHVVDMPIIHDEPEPLETAVAAPPAPAPKAAAEPAPQHAEFVSPGQEAKDIFAKKFGDDGAKSKFIDSIVDLLDTMAHHDYDKAEILLSEMVKTTEKDGGLYQEIGRVTRKLHDSISEFRMALDPRIKMLANEDVPNAVDNLQFVMKKTEEAANKTMTIVEKYLGMQSDYTKHIQSVIGTPDTTQYLEKFNKELFEDLTNILVAQEFQDITGQTIRKVIDLVNAVETELVSLIATFGVNIEEGKAMVAPETVEQSDVEDLLKEFGF